MKTLEDIILDAYRDGVFPMAESAGDEDFAFYKPYLRAIVPIADLHIPAKLLKTIRRRKYTITIDRAFENIIEGCAAATSEKRSKTWINGPIRDIFTMLHRQGRAHSIECWNGGRLAGGLYGLAIGAVFCGESMVSFERDASKVALVALCALLWKSRFTILDAQFINPHLLQFGTYEIPQEEYEGMIKAEMNKNVPLANGNLQSIMEEYLEFRRL